VGPLVELNRLSQTQETGDQFPLAKRHQALIRNDAAIADLKIITLNQTFCRHFLHHKAETCPGSITQTQRILDLGRVKTVNFLVAIHRQYRENRPLVGVTKRLGIGDGGRKHDRSGVIDYP